MTRLAIITIMCLSWGHVYPQWEALGGGVYNTTITKFVYDSALQQTYVFGGFVFAFNDNGDTLVANGTAIWKNDQWLPMEQGIAGISIFEAPYSAEFWNGELYVGGGFDAMNGLPNTKGLAKWSVDHWEPWASVSSNSGVRRVRLIDDELHVVGHFDSIAGAPMGQYGIWNGTTWRDGSDTIPDFFNGTLTEVVKYLGTIYVAGNFHPNNMPVANDIMRYGSNGWEPVGAGVNGGLVYNMVEFNDLLYVCGSFSGSGNLYSQSVLAWDGSQWSKPFPGVEWVSLVGDVDVIGGRLVINGKVRLEGTAEVYGLFYYDGTTACLAGGENTAIKAFDGMADTLLVATCETLTCQPGGLVTNGFAKWVFTNPADTCLQIVTGIEELPEQSHERLGVFPNPAENNITLVWPSNWQGTQNITIRVFDLSGRSLFTRTSSVAGQQRTMDILGLADGLYFIEATEPLSNKIARGSFVKQ